MDPVGTLLFWNWKCLPLVVVGEFGHGWRCWVEGENLVLVMAWDVVRKRRMVKRRRKWQCFMFTVYLFLRGTKWWECKFDVGFGGWFYRHRHVRHGWFGSIFLYAICGDIYEAFISLCEHLSTLSWPLCPLIEIKRLMMGMCFRWKNWRKKYRGDKRK